MKSLFLVLTSLVISIMAFSQTKPTVTIITEGARSRQVVVDNKTYTITNPTTGTTQSIVISNLQPGPHTLSVIRANLTRNPNGTSFTLREGYDLTLTVSANGSLSTSETRVGRGANAGNQQLSVTQFNRIYNQAKSRTGATARAKYLETQLETTNRKITAQQARQLILLVNSESLRLKLAKQSYLKISDQQNFHLMFELLNSTASKNSLNDYLVSVKNNTDVSGDQLTEAEFTTVYNEVVAESSTADRVYYLNNFFSRDFNYYTAEQARRLLFTISGEQNRLSLAKTAYRGVVNKNDYYNTVYSLFTSSSSRSNLQSYVNTYVGGNNDGYNTAMSATEFNKLLSNVSNSWSSSTKFSLVATAFNTASNYFTTAQIRQLLLQISAEADRVTLAKNAYDNTVDRASFSQLYDLIASTNGRNELIAYVNNYQTGTVPTKLAMSDTEFNKLYRDVQLTFGLGAKYRSLTEIFNTETNYFTVSQAKQLIQLVSSESNRLELAKISYNNITDPANFNSVLDIFTSQSSKNELLAYVGSNASLQ